MSAKSVAFVVDAGDPAPTATPDAERRTDTQDGRTHHATDRTHCSCGYGFGSENHLNRHLDAQTGAQDGRTTAEWVAHLVKARQAAEAEVARLREVQTPAERLLDETGITWQSRARRLASRLAESRAKVTRVEVLADDLEREGAAYDQRGRNAFAQGAEAESIALASLAAATNNDAVALRAALADPEPRDE